MTRRALAMGFALFAGLAARPVAAELPSFLRTENGQVREGNEQLAKGDAKAALESYNKAARELPDAPGVQLNRGLSLLKQGDLTKAREALLAATQPGAPNELRADAYQDLSLAFYKEGDALAGQNKHEDAQKMFRESLDAAKRSLRLRPGDPNTAWNLELAARRVREEQEKQKQEEEKKKQEEQQKQDKSSDQQNPDQDQDQGKDQDQKQDQDQDQKQQDKAGDQDKKPEPQSADSKDQPKPEADKNEPDQSPKPEPKGQDQKSAEPESKQDGKPDQALPPEAEQALDSLEGSEENYERHRARQRAARERRAPEKDW